VTSAVLPSRLHRCNTTELAMFSARNLLSLFLCAHCARARVYLLCFAGSLEAAHSGWNGTSDLEKMTIPRLELSSSPNRWYHSIQNELLLEIPQNTISTHERAHSVHTKIDSRDFVRKTWRALWCYNDGVWKARRRLLRVVLEASGTQQPVLLVLSLLFTLCYICLVCD